MVRLRRHTPVTVEVPALEPFEAAVVEADEEGALLALLRGGRDGSRGRVPTRFYNRQPAELRAVTRVGLIRRAGVLEAVASSRARRVREDVLRFRAAPDADRVTQRRDSVRAEAILPATVRPEALGAERPARTLNLSGGGVLLSGARELREEERLDLALSLPEETVEAGGRVVRASADGLRGIALDRIRPGDRERLIHYVFERQRAGLRRTRDG